MAAASLIMDAVEVHAEGEAGRVITNGADFVQGSTMAERFEYCRTHLDHIRRLLIREPRGYPGMCAVFLLPPISDEADFGIVVLEQAGFTPMSGSNTICTVTAVIEAGLLPAVEPVTQVTLETAVGLVRVDAEVRNGKVLSVTIRNVPAFVVGLDVPLEVEGFGTVPADIVFGGQFYAQVDAASLGLELHPSNGKELVRAGALIKLAALEQAPVEHPLNPEINHVNLVMLHSGAHLPGKQARNTVVSPAEGIRIDDPRSWTGALDRSPCGTGTSGRMAALHARGELRLDEEFRHKGILDTEFVGKLVGTTEIGGRPAVLPTIRGRGWVTGTARWTLDPTDPFPDGYTVGDIWGPETE
ncbi:MULTISPECIES: proline racemase family protein [Microbacterium]|uniref:proline racemase family protein n=1 Tax=Microbacterium TaxID=33882 RepID=UPI000D64F124|nr:MULTISPECIES: proline racemase family protein [Microbacterium]